MRDIKIADLFNEVFPAFLSHSIIYVSSVFYYIVFVVVVVLSFLFLLQDVQFTFKLCQ